MGKTKHGVQLGYQKLRFDQLGDINTEASGQILQLGEERSFDFDLQLGEQKHQE